MRSHCGTGEGEPRYPEKPMEFPLEAQVSGFYGAESLSARPKMPDKRERRQAKQWA